MTADAAIKAADPVLESIADNKARVDKFHADLKANPIKKTSRKLTGALLTVASYTRPDFRVVIEDMTVTLEDVLRPEYWANVGDKVFNTMKNHPFPCIEVIWGDASKYLRLLVVDAAPLWVKVKVLELVNLNDQDAGEELPDEPTGYTIKRVNPSLGWCIIRDADKQRLKEKLGTRQEAEKELADLLRALKA